MSLNAAVELAGYRLNEAITDGDLFLARRLSDSLPVTVKRLDAEPKNLQLLEQLRSLNHENLGRVLEVGRESDTHYLVSEFVDGVTARQLLRAAADCDEDLSLSVCLELVGQVARGLSALHGFSRSSERGGLAHGDVSPSNIVLGFDGTVRLIDFGTLARHGELLKASKATLGFVAPERLESPRAARQSDVFALGAVLFELLTGHGAFEAAVHEQSAERALNEAPLDVLDYRDDVPPELVELLYEMLAKDPLLRPSAVEVAERCYRVIETLAVAADLAAYVSSFFERRQEADHDSDPELRSNVATTPPPPRVGEPGAGWRISGAAVTATFEYLVHHFGSKGYERVRAKLSPSSARVLAQHIRSDSWFDASVVIELTEIAEASFGSGDGSLARAIGVSSADFAFSDDGPFRVFRQKGQREGVPAFLKSTEDIYGLYYDRGQWRIESLGEGIAHCRHVFGAAFPRPISERIFAYLLRGMELVGAREVNVDRQPDGMDLVVTVSWS